MAGVWRPPAAHPNRGFGALTARAVRSPEEVATIRALGNSDPEHLVRGRIEPYEIEIQDVVRTPPSRPRGRGGGSSRDGSAEVVGMRAPVPKAEAAVAFFRW